MTATEATLAGRAAAEALMQDACTINRPDTTGVLDEDTLQYVTTAGAEVYEGPCRVKPRDNEDRVVHAGEQPVSLWPYIVSVPMSVTAVALDDLVTITGSDLDPALVGLVLRVRQVLAGTHLTARRLGCEVNVG